jgi:trk system potassium uptake protein
MMLRFAEGSPRVQTLSYRPIFRIAAAVVILVAAVMLVPAVYGWIVGDTTATGFAVAAAIVGAIGGSVLFVTRGAVSSLKPRDMFLVTGLAWVSSCAAATVALSLTLPDLSMIDAIFESVSGMTTTGSTVLIGLDTMPRPVLLWRSLTQWLGGIGIIGMSVAILPFLRIGGMRLFRTESSEWSETPVARITTLARQLGGVYVALTALCGLCYWWFEMTPFDAINHAMTTVATGGYSTRDTSLGAYPNTISWIATVFMLTGSIPFVLYVRALGGQPKELWRSGQIRVLLQFLSAVIVGLTIYLLATGNYTSVVDALTDSAANVVSIVTTTGYATTDYTLWGQFAIAGFFMITFVGACSGSTSGGIKIFRFRIATGFLREQLLRLVHPNAIVKRHYDGKRIDDEPVTPVIAFAFAFFIAFAVTSVILAMIGLDFTTALSGAATALANVGPGLGEIIGPAGNFQSLPTAAKAVLCAAMLLGRLEIFTLLVLFSPRYWRY